MSGNYHFCKTRSGLRIVTVPYWSLISGECVFLAPSMDKILCLSLSHQSALVAFLQSSKENATCESFDFSFLEPSTNMLCGNVFQVKMFYLRGRQVMTQEILKAGLLKTQEVNNSDQEVLEIYLLSTLAEFRNFLIMKNIKS